MIKRDPIYFHFLKPCFLPNRRVLKQFISAVFKRENRSLGELSIIFCDDEYVLGLNKQFLNHDYYTDILSFPLSVKGEPLRAEIYISVDRVRENARIIPSTSTEELHRVIFHGVLHFCGYKDKSPADIKTMRFKEDKYLKAYFH
jgi:probable rRNA maturation factor